MVSRRSFPSELRNSPERSTSLGYGNGRATHETLYLHSRSSCSEQRIVAGNQLQLITGYAVASPPSVFSAHRRTYRRAPFHLVRKGLNGARIILLDTVGHC